MRACADTPQLRGVRLLWLPVADNEKYLLLEDEETGDVLLPLIYMKSVFEANYSRKLSSLKHRLVVLPSAEVLGGGEVGNKRKNALEGDLSRGFVYWQWAFESPHEVKVLVRQALGDPQGHLRLILLPIVYNAMAQKQKLRSTPFFRALHRALRSSNYFELLKLPPDVEAELAEAEKATLSLSLGNSDMSNMCGEGKVFNGPHDLYKTLAKYTLSYEAAEDSDISKRRCMSTGAQRENLSSMLPSSMGTPPAYGAVALSSGIWQGGSVAAEHSETNNTVVLELQKQSNSIAHELHLLRKECESNMQSIYSELFSMRRWLADVAQQLMPRLPPPSRPPP